MDACDGFHLLARLNLFSDLDEAKSIPEVKAKMRSLILDDGFGPPVNLGN